MSDPDRLAELERQRRSVAAHLDWLDREIARAREAAPAPAEPRVRPTSDPQVDPASPETPAEVVPLFDPAPPPSKVGCWAVFVASLLLLTSIALGLIYWRYSTD